MSGPLPGTQRLGFRCITPPDRKSPTSIPPDTAQLPEGGLFAATPQSTNTGRSGTSAIERMLSKLRRTYQSTSLSQIIFDLGEDPHQECFVMPTIIELVKDPQTREYTRKVTQLDSIFSQSSPQKKSVLIAGSPGLGKSTLCEQIARMWSQNELWSSRFQAGIFLIRIRDLNERNYPNTRTYSLVDIIKQQCFNNNLLPLEYEKLQELMQEHPEQFLIILDGYDEISPIAQNGYLSPALSDLRNETCCLITARPEQTTGLLINQRLELMGFTQSEIRTYIENFFTQGGNITSDQTIDLLNFLESQPLVREVSQIPLLLGIICQLAKNGRLVPSNNTRLTVSNLYNQFIGEIFKRYLLRTNQANELTPQDVLDQLATPIQNNLEQLAYYGILNNKSSFSKEDISQIIRANNITDATLILQHVKECIDSGLLRHINNEYHFIHLTFQDYCAACRVAGVLQQHELGSVPYEEMRQFIVQNRYNPRLNVMWAFVAGNLAKHLSSSKHFFNILMTEPRDLLSSYERQLLIRCIAESGEPTNLIATRVQLLLQPLLKLLQNHNSDPDRRINAVREISKLGVAAVIPAVFDVLLTLMQDTDFRIRKAAIEVIGKLGSRAATTQVLDRLVHLMQNDYDCEVVNAAVEAIFRMGAAAAIPEVINVLVRELLSDYSSRINVDVIITAISQLYSTAATSQVLSQLVVALENQNSPVRRILAAQAISKLGAKAATPPVFDALEMVLLQNADPDLLKCVERAIVKLGQSSVINGLFDKLVARLESNNPTLKANAAEAIYNIDEVAATATSRQVMALITVMQHDNDLSVRTKAMLAIRRLCTVKAIEPVFDQLVKTLITALGDDGIMVRSEAAVAIGILGSRAATPDILDKLVAAIDDEHLQVRLNAMQCICNFGSEAATEAVISKLIAAMKDENYEVRLLAMLALSNLRLKIATEPLLDVLVAEIHDENLEVRLNAIKLICDLGSEAVTEPVVNALVVAMQGMNSAVKLSVANSICNLGVTAALPQVLDVLVSAMQDDSLGYSAQKAICNLGSKAATTELVLNVLVAAMKDENYKVRLNAMSCICNLGTKAAIEPIFNALITVIKNDVDMKCKLEATRVINELGSEALLPEVFNVLIAMMQDGSDSNAILNAMTCICNLGSRAATEPVFNALVSVMQNNANGQCKLEAIQVIIRLGSEALPPLVFNVLLAMMQNNSDPNARLNAMRCICNCVAKAATSQVLDVLVSVMQHDTNMRCKLEAAQAIIRLSSERLPAALNLLVRVMLDDGDPNVRQSAIGIIYNLGTQGATLQVLDALVSVMQNDATVKCKVKAAEAIVRLSTPTPTQEVINALLSVAEYSHALLSVFYKVRCDAIKIIANFGSIVSTDRLSNILVMMLNDGLIPATVNAIPKLGVRVATNQVCNKLVTILEDNKHNYPINIDTAKAICTLWARFAVIMPDRLVEFLQIPQISEYLQDSINLADLIDILPTPSVSTEPLYNAVAESLVHIFIQRGNSCLFYDQYKDKLCWWEGDSLRSVVLPRQSRIKLIEKIRTAFTRQTGLALTTLAPQGDTSLHIAAKTNNLTELARLLATSKSDIDNQNNPLGYTPLMGAISSNRLETATMLVNAGANVSLVASRRGRFHTAISLAADTPGTASNRVAMLKLLLRKRQMIGVESLQQALNDLLNEYNGVPGNEVANDDLLNDYIGRLAAITDLVTLKSEKRLPYLAHLESIAGKINRGSGTPEEKLEGFRPEEFLPIRLCLYTELYLRLQRNLIVIPPSLTKTSVDMQVLLQQEMSLILETLNNRKETLVIINASTANSDEREILFKELALNILNKISKLADGEFYQCYTGYYTDTLPVTANSMGHAVYILFTRQGSIWSVQLNNCGDGVNEYHAPNGTKETFPYWVGTFYATDLTPDNEVLVTYIMHVLKAASYMKRDEAYGGLYTREWNFTTNKGEPPLALKDIMPSMKWQNVGNCAVYNCNVSLKYRLMVRYGSEIGEAIYSWLINQEHQLIGCYHPNPGNV